MPSSVRTQISLSARDEFNAFAKLAKLNLFQGDWIPPAPEYGRYICYAYSNSDVDTMANLTYINLKHENLEKAFYVYLNRATHPHTVFSI